MLKKRVIPKILIKKLDIQKEKVIVSPTTKKFNDNKNYWVASKSSNNF